MADSEEPEANDDLDAATQRQVIRERYAGIAAESDTDEGSCCSSDECCDGGTAATTATDGTARQLGYSTTDLAAVGGDANLGLGCGNPQALADLEAGETVLDLGSGAGFDCFLAGREVGDAGRVIGVDMTPAMVEKARENIAENDASNVEFRLGEIEHLPVADATVDVVISNCAVNLSPAKSRVFEEAFRVLGPGGRLAIADVVLTAEIPPDVRADPDSVAACVAGASTIDALERTLASAGFEAVAIAPKNGSERFISDWDEDRDLGEFLVSATITGRKPAKETSAISTARQTS